MVRVYSILFLILIAVSSCNKAELMPVNNSGSHIVGKWRLFQTITYSIPADPNDQGDVVDEMGVEFYEIFKANGDYSMVIGDGTGVSFELQGTYRLSDDPEKLFITMGGETQEIKIVELTRDRYVYEDIDEDGRHNYVYIRAED